MCLHVKYMCTYIYARVYTHTHTVHTRTTHVHAHTCTYYTHTGTGKATAVYINNIIANYSNSSNMALTLLT